MLTQRGRLVITQPVLSWRQRVLESGVLEVPVSGDIGILATDLEDFPTDSADRIIAATALSHGATLIPADENIFGRSSQLQCHDGRR